MMFLKSNLKRTLSALALSLPESSGLSSSTCKTCARQMRISKSSGMGNDMALFPGSGRVNHRLFSSFQAPEPPKSKGFNIFGDVDLSVSESSSSQSSMRNADPDSVFVVNGASRGIGLQFITKLLEDTKGRIVACCRSPNEALKLQNLASSLDEKSRQRLDLVQLDVENQDSIEKAALEIKTKYNRVDLLLNVAGILGDGDSTPGPERTVRKIDRKWMDKSFSVNCIGPVMLTRELAPLMAQKRKSIKEKYSGDHKEKKRAAAIVANLSARVSSVSDNELGGWYSYRMSKAALNQATRTLAHELKRESVWCIALHPGTTDTDLSKPFQKNVQKSRLFPVEFTVDSLMDVIDSLEEGNSGGLYDWAGKAIPF